MNTSILSIDSLKRTESLELIPAPRKIGYGVLETLRTYNETRPARVPLNHILLFRSLRKGGFEGAPSEWSGKIIILWNIRFKLFGSEWVYYFDVDQNELGYISLEDVFPPNSFSLVKPSH